MTRKIFNPGIYDISSEEYHSSSGISRSGIMEFKKSAKHFYHKYINPNYVKKPPTPDLEFGTALHCYVLEPNKFDQEYVIKPEKRDKLPDVPLLKDVGREEYDKAKLDYETERKRRQQEDLSFYHYSLGKKIIEKSDFEKIKVMSDQFSNDPYAIELINGARYEKSIYWIDEDTKLLCKCRPDIMHENLIVDLKSTTDASSRSFERDFYKYGYHIQVGMLHEGIKAVKGKLIHAFIDLAIEKEEPYCHAIHEIDESYIEKGRKEFKYYLAKMKECFDKNHWPTYPINTIYLPKHLT